MIIDGKSTEFGSWSLNDIVKNRFFRVPDYQRGYAWTERQLEEFWGDLCAVVQSKGKHYTGAITVKALPVSLEMPLRNGFEVVDGQQRLTTIAILLSILTADDNPLVVKEKDGSHYIFSYGEQNDDLPFLCAILSGNELGIPENSHQQNLKKAFKYFEAKVAELDSENKRGFANALQSSLMFDFRIIESDYHTGMVFETMNNRGKPLTLLEKLKNRLMYLLDTLQPDVDDEPSDVFDDEKADLHDKIDETWGKIYRLLANNPEQPPLDEDEFLAAHLSVYRAPKESVYSKAVAESRLFKMFCSNAETHPKSERIDENKAVPEKIPMEESVSIKKIRTYVEDLDDFVEPWSKIHTDFDGALGRCRLLSGTQEVKVFLTTVLLHVDNEEMRKSIFENAELIMFRNTVRSIMDEATFATLARRLHGKCLDMLKKGEKEKIEPEQVENMLCDFVNNEKHQLEGQNLVDYFADLMTRQHSPHGFYAWKGLKYFLFTQEGCDGLSWEQFDEVTLEHILPQVATSDRYTGWWLRQIREIVTISGFGDWDTLSDQERRACRQCKRKLVNSLGNFVLLTQSENASVSDDPWEGYSAIDGMDNAIVGKKAFYSDPNKTSSNGARHVAQANDTWNAFRIRTRGHALFKSLAKALGIAGELKPDRINCALGFDYEKTRLLQDTLFPKLSAEEANPLVPKLDMVVEEDQEAMPGPQVNAENVAFWEAFKKWCVDNQKDWCVATVAPRGNTWYDPEGFRSPMHIFFTNCNRSASISKQGPLVTIGVYCHHGEVQRQEIKKYCQDFKVTCDYQDWDFRKGYNGAKRICFITKADWHHPTPELFRTMANNYEAICSVLRKHGAFLA